MTDPRGVHFWYWCYECGPLADTVPMGDSMRERVKLGRDLLYDDPDDLLTEDEEPGDLVTLARCPHCGGPTDAIEVYEK